MFRKSQVRRHLLEVYDLQLTYIESITDKSSKEYAVAVRNAESFNEMLFPENNNMSVNINTVILAAANILGLLIVLNFEKVNVIASKAFGMLMKLTPHV